MRSEPTSPGGRDLAPRQASLVLGVPPAPAGTLFLRSAAGGAAFRPGEGREVWFGRGRAAREDAHLSVGDDDLRVSRRQGALTHQLGRWWLRNTGRLPLRLPGSVMLDAAGPPVSLADGYTPLFLCGTPGRVHVLELYVARAGEERPPVRRRAWPLKPDERLSLIVLGQRYLLHEAFPRPLTWQQAAGELDVLLPEEGWRPKKLAHKVAEVRRRLSLGGVRGLTVAEVGQPVGNALNHNLLTELLRSATLNAPDLAELNRPRPSRA